MLPRMDPHVQALAAGKHPQPQLPAQPAASGPTTSTLILIRFPHKSIAYYKTKIEWYVRTQELFTQNGTVRKALLHKLPAHRWTERASRTQVPKARYYNCWLWFSSSFDYTGLHAFLDRTLHSSALKKKKKEKKKQKKNTHTHLKQRRICRQPW